MSGGGDFLREVDQSRLGDPGGVNPGHQENRRPVMSAGVVGARATPSPSRQGMVRSAAVTASASSAPRSAPDPACRRRGPRRRRLEVVLRGRVTRQRQRGHRRDEDEQALPRSGHVPEEGGRSPISYLLHPVWSGHDRKHPFDDQCLSAARWFRRESHHGHGERRHGSGRVALSRSRARLPPRRAVLALVWAGSPARRRARSIGRGVQVNRHVGIRKHHRADVAALHQRFPRATHSRCRPQHAADRRDRATAAALASMAGVRSPAKVLAIDRDAPAIEVEDRLLAERGTAASSLRSNPVWTAFHATARYIAPVSTCR